MPENGRTPGEVIRAELERRGWTQDDLARILGRHRPEMNSIIQGKRGISPDLAVGLAAALGQTPEYWLGLEVARQLNLVEDDAGEVARRARIYDFAPVKDMERRGWIAPAESATDLEAGVCRFFGIRSIDESPILSVSARKRDRLAPLTVEQQAWAFRAKQLAQTLQVAPFTPARLPQLEKKLRELAAYPEEARHLPRVFAEYGIRFVIVEPLPSGSIDGAAFWLDDKSPVIAVSVRIDRVDAFWFTVCHEFAHIRNDDAQSVDADLVGQDRVLSKTKDEIERRADDEAEMTLVPKHEIESFIRRVSPLYSKPRIVQFAHKLKIHPGIIVGQLQHRGEMGWNANREMLVKIRERVASTALTDGWGRTVGIMG